MWPLTRHVPDVSRGAIVVRATDIGEAALSTVKIPGRSGQTTRRHRHHGLVTMVPLLPTATKRPLPQVTSFKFKRSTVAIPVARTQWSPSGLYMIVPSK